MNVASVEIPVGNQTIRGNVYTPTHELGRLAALFLHGWTGRPNENAASVLAENGFQAMTFSMRGHNTSDGSIDRVSRQDSLADALAAYDYFRAQIPEGTGVVLVGNSYGGYMSEVLSSKRPVAGLSLRVPAAYLNEGFDEPQIGQGNNNVATMSWRNTPVGFEGNLAFEALHVFRGPVQLIEAENDDAIPHQAVQNQVAAIADASQLEYHFMQGWPHSLGDDVERNGQFQGLLLGWLRRIATE